MNEKGYIKFNCIWSETGPVDEKLIVDINRWREILYQKGLIGEYPNNIGYGNISTRLVGNIFIITGTATGKLKTLTAEHYSKVIAYNLEKNSLTCMGPVKASSESLSHAALYASCLSANAIIHVHNKKLWEQLMKTEIATSANVEYGTPEMAKEIIRLFKETDLKKRGIFVMAGHEDGIVSFGKDMDEAGEILLKTI